MSANPKDSLLELHALDFGGKGEAFVESEFLTPLLKCLGYESHKDYEVVRHGDDGSAFKLHYPPVEQGAQRVKHYNPDYVPTIRKKMFWIIEAKSPKDVPYPFETKYLVQGLQYCIHPEIQAKYLLVTNGVHSAVYDAHGAVFFEKEIYEPILDFRSSELIGRWDEIFNLLSVETLRTRIEVDLKAMYDKLCLSSLDETYPQRLLRQIGASASVNARQIKHHVAKLYVEGMEREKEIWRTDMEQLSAAQVFDLMDLPLRGGPKSEGYFFVMKSLAEGISAREVFNTLTKDFPRQCIFRKIQTFMALCDLHNRADDEVKALCGEFFDLYKDADLPLLNQVECALLRLTRKISVVSLYPPLRQRLQQELATAPELIRFVRPPTALSLIYPAELLQNRQLFEEIKVLTDEQLREQLTGLLKSEAQIEDDFRTARANLPGSEQDDVTGFETYGVGGKHYAFKHILINRSLEPNPYAPASSL